MDKLLWSWWSWLWNDQSTTTSPTTTTTALPTLKSIRNFTSTAVTGIHPTIPTTEVVDKITQRTDSVVAGFSSTVASTPFTIINKTVNTLRKLSEGGSPPTSTPASSILLTPAAHHPPPAHSSFFATSTTDPSTLSVSINHQQVQTIQQNSTASLPLSSAFSTFSTFLEYDTSNSYGSSADYFGNFSISSVSPSSTTSNFTDDLSDVTISSGGVFSGGIGGIVGDEFLSELWNCSVLSGCCTKSATNGSVIAFFQNGTGNCTESGTPEIETTLHLLVVLSTAIILGIIILATVIGNVFVIAAILLERNLQSVANYLILSLAVADLLVACLVMPLSAVYEVSKEWKLGPELCDMWTSCDVLCCTASILHLVAIALDRYWAVTNIDYIHQRTARRIGVMILVIWALSCLVSIAPLLGWKDSKWDERVSKDFQCIVSQDIGYQIFATASSFYVPLLVILVLYWRIFQTARKRIRRRQQGKSIVHLMPKAFVTATPPSSGGGLIATAAGGSGGIAAAVVTVIGRPLPTISETTTAFTNISSTHTSPEKGSYGNGVDRVENDPPTADISTYGTTGTTPNFRPTITRKKTQTSVDSKRERKAAKTLAIITGAFVCCWLPFFILAILLPTCQCEISPLAMSLSLWLGYFNSTLNPIIYTIFSPEFRHAFKRILCGRRNSIRRRTRCVRR
ncbi:5-hydroxytryptamine receptor-like isoform X2 [Hermetia illucens]|uniref:5-hydroxytryptamine receptor-like isoform X2 n=1 Tax=Hermetia illucens TaxID=343691 RepID=UPI0018CC1602|nr:5-hydroxytryptamine receptor-like isoform X2 [Hermetia illucens]